LSTRKELAQKLRNAHVKPVTIQGVLHNIGVYLREFEEELYLVTSVTSDVAVDADDHSVTIHGTTLKFRQEKQEIHVEYKAGEDGWENYDVLFPSETGTIKSARNEKSYTIDNIDGLLDEYVAATFEHLNL